MKKHSSSTRPELGPKAKAAIAIGYVKIVKKIAYIQTKEATAGEWILLFGVLRPMECGAYSFGVNEKQNRKLFLCELCASVVIYYVEH